MNSYSNTVSNPFLEGYWLDLRVTVPVWLPQNSEGYQRASDIPQVTDFFFSFLFGMPPPILKPATVTHNRPQEDQASNANSL